ncbi:uncharacterized protein LOC144000385 isoform X2 [Lithobates pipiens]
MSGNLRKVRPPVLNSKPQPPMTDHRQFIRNFSFHNCKLGNQGFQRLLLQVFGYLGHGKSSFINTCKIVWDNSAYNNYTKASTSHGGATTDRRTYQLTENIILVDNRGCAAMKSHEKGEIFAQLANLMPLNMKVDWCQGFKLADRIVEAEPLVQPSDFISPIFVYSVGHSPNPEEKQELKEILKTCREMTGVEAIIVLTHKSTGKLEKAEAMFRDLGATHVFSLENYTPKNQSTSTEVDNSVLKFLYEVVQDSIFRVGHSRDPQKEMTERKIFVLNYIHNKELEAHIQKLEGQKAAENAQMERAIKVKKEEAERQKQKDQKEHEEKIRQLEEEFQRQRLRDQYEYEQRLKDIQQRGKRK